HLHQPLELVADLLDHHRRPRGDDGDAREVLLVLGLGDRERVDVVPASREQPDHPGENARLVVDQHRQRVPLDLLLDGLSRIVARTRVTACVAHYTSTLPRSSIAFWMSPATSASSISLCALPDGIIGKQFSAWSTTQSKITGLSTSIISLMA